MAEKSERLVWEVPKKREVLLWDMEKPIAEAGPPVLPPEMMEVVDGLEVMANMIKNEEKTEYCFGVVGSCSTRIDPILQKAGIKRVHTRHEETAGDAADAWGRITGRPGVMSISTGTGASNAAGALLTAKAAQSPVVAIIGEAAVQFDKRWTYQGGIRCNMFLPEAVKWVQTVYHPAVLLYWVKKAFREAVSPPTGPTAVAIPEELVFFKGSYQPMFGLWNGYVQGTWPIKDPARTRGGAHPAVVEEAIKWLLEAERPAMIVGEAIHYEDAEEELKEFVYLLGIPCHARRVSRGAISEYDPLNCHGRARGRVMRSSDRALVMGLRCGYLEWWGQAPFWGPMTRYIQAQTCEDNQCLQLATEYEMNGSMKVILRQFIDCLKSLGITKPVEKWNDWRAWIAEEKAAVEKRTLERTERLKGVSPLHPDLVSRIIAEFLDEELDGDFYYCPDSLIASSFAGDWLKMKYSARQLDAADPISYGHGVGHAIGAGLATDRKTPIFVMMGEGSMGSTACDIETCARWDIPAVFIHQNNNGQPSNMWRPWFKKICMATGNIMRDSTETLPWIRYDRMYAEFGCHTEFVMRDAELRPALKRATDWVRNKCKPAFIEVHVEPEVNADVMAMFSSLIYGFVKWDELPVEGQRYILTQRMAEEPWVSFGADPSWKEAAEKYARGELPLPELPEEPLYPEIYLPHDGIRF